MDMGKVIYKYMCVCIYIYIYIICVYGMRNLNISQYVSKLPLKIYGYGAFYQHLIF